MTKIIGRDFLGLDQEENLIAIHRDRSIVDSFFFQKSLHSDSNRAHHAFSSLRRHPVGCPSVKMNNSHLVGCPSVKTNNRRLSPYFFSAFFAICFLVHFFQRFCHVREAIPFFVECCSDEKGDVIHRQKRCDFRRTEDDRKNLASLTVLKKNNPPRSKEVAY